jgi:hypothetical protein
MARKQDRGEGGHPVFWLLLGFLCGVMATLGALLLLIGRFGAEAEPAVASPVVSIPIPPPGGPVILAPSPLSVDAATPIQEPVARPTLPTFKPEPAPEPAAKAAPRLPPPATKPAATPRPAAPPRRSTADQIAEDAAASGMTTRTR